MATQDSTSTRDAVTGVGSLARTWSPSATTSRGTVYVLFGRGEHAGVYERFGSRLAYDGYLVQGFESTTTEDGVRATVAAPEQTEPVVLIGSDTGALKALVLAAQLGNRVAGVVVAGTPASTTSGPADWDDELDARSACPVHRGRLATDVVRGALAASPVPPELTRSALSGRPDLPVLLVHGDADSVAPIEDALALASRLPQAETVVVRGGRHDVLNDVSHRSVAAAIVQFLERLHGSVEAAPVLVTAGGRRR